MTINVVGMGTNEGEMTVKGYQMVKSGLPIFVRSERLRGLDTLKKEGIAFESFDDIYELAQNFDELNSEIAKRLKEKAQEHTDIVYLVDGSGTYEKSLEIDGVDFEFFPTLSKASDVHARFGKGESLLEISSYDFVKIENFGGIMSRYIYIFDIDGGQIASDVKLKLGKIMGDEEKIIFCQGGKYTSVCAYEIDRQKKYDENTGIFVRVNDTLEKTVFNFTDLLNIMDRLRADDGCPWDKAQTHESIRMCAIEEAYEVAEAIDMARMDKLQEEVGDLMLQTVLHAKIASDEGEFAMPDVLTELCQKLIDRHTHVFGKDKAQNATDALATWENNKEKLKKQDTALQAVYDVPKTLPAIMYAEKVAKKVAKTGFDFSNVSQIFDKIIEELDELKNAVKDNSNIEEELGDVFFAASNLSRFLKLNGELALTKSTQKFISRFEKMSEIINMEKLDFKNMSEEQQNEVYLRAKDKLSQVD